MPLIKDVGDSLNSITGCNRSANPLAACLAASHGADDLHLIPESQLLGFFLTLSSPASNPMEI